MAKLEKELRLIGERIRQIRKNKKFTQEKLAELSNLDPTYISEVENGKANYTVFTLFSICNSLEVRMSDVLEAAYQPQIEQSFSQRFSKLTRVLKNKDSATKQKILRILETLLND